MVSMHTPPRVRLPDDRRAVTATLVLTTTDGPLEVTVTVGLYDDGRPGEVFVGCGQHGETVRGLLDQWAIAVSVGLQHGIPLATYVSKARHARFSPWGRGTIPGDDRPHEASSVLDLVARYLERFCAAEAP